MDTRNAAPLPVSGGRDHATASSFAAARIITAGLVPCGRCGGNGVDRDGICRRCGGVGSLPR